MMTVLEAINLSTEYLQKKGIESARLNSELLLSDILNCPRLSLYLAYDRPLKKAEVDRYREYIARRGTFEPYQYIIGKVEFYGLEFKVDNNVLIPRQETELLVEEVLNKIKSIDKPVIKVLDIGTGSGNISVALAVNAENIEVYAIDISESALNIARQNASRHNVSERINFAHYDILDKKFLDENQKFDILVSNPPYVGAEEYPELQKEIVNYEPKQALTDDKDGYSFYEGITDLANDILHPGGVLFYEMGIGQSERIGEIMRGTNFTTVSVLNDYLGVQRVIVGEKK